MAKIAQSVLVLGVGESTLPIVRDAVAQINLAQQADTPILSSALTWEEQDFGLALKPVWKPDSLEWLKDPIRQRHYSRWLSVEEAHLKNLPPKQLAHWRLILISQFWHSYSPLRNHLNQLFQSMPKGTVWVHLLADLSSPVSAAWYLDLAFWVRRLLTQMNLSPYMMVYLSLPPAETPSLYAQLRQLERVNSPTQPIDTNAIWLDTFALEPVAYASSEDALQNFRLDRAIFDNVFLYEQNHPTAISNALALQANVQIAQQIREITHNWLMQNHLMNQNRQTQQEPQTISVGSARAVRLGVPFWQITEGWNFEDWQRLLEKWLAPPQADNRQFLNWIKNHPQIPFLQLLLKAHDRRPLPTQLSSWRDLIIPAGNNIMPEQAQNGLNNFRPGQDPVSDSLKQYDDPHHLRAQGHNRLAKFFAPFYPHDAIHVGEYTLALERVYEMWKGELGPYFEDMLLGRLQNASLPQVITDLEYLIHWLRVAHAQLAKYIIANLHNPLQHYQAISASLFTNNTQKQFLDSIKGLSQDLQAALLQKAILGLLEDACDWCMKQGQNLLLWHASLEKLFQAPPRPPLLESAPPYRHLINTPFLGETYRKRASLAPLPTHSWRFEGSAQDRYLVWQFDSLQVDQAHQLRMEDFLALTRGRYRSEKDFFSILNLIQKQVLSLADIAQYLNIAYEPLLKGQPESKDLQTQLIHLLVSEAIQTPDYRNHQMAILQNLQIRGAETTEGHDSNWLNLLVMDGLYPLDKTHAYRSSKEHYEQQKKRGANIEEWYFLDAEVQAAHYEKALNLSLPLPNELLQLLANPHLVMLFSRAHAYGYLYEEVLPQHGNAIALRIGSETFWLGLNQPQTGWGWLVALANLYREQSLATGDRAEFLPSSLSHFQIEKSLDDWLKNEAQHVKDDFESFSMPQELIPYTRHIRKQDVEDWMPVFINYGAWYNYHQFLVSQDTNNPTVKLFFRCLATLAQAQLDEIKAKLMNQRIGNRTETHGRRTFRR